MPSPVIHLTHALGFGTFIMASTKGTFTALHCLILAFNALFGPDIGAFFGWCLSTTSIVLARAAMDYIHHSLGYVLLIAPLLAILSAKLSRKLHRWQSDASAPIDLGDVNASLARSHGMSLAVKDCYFLAIAGCLLHFQIDHIFEENGQDKLYRWVLSTGYFTSPTPPLLPASVVLVGGCTLILFVGFAWIHLFSPTLSKQVLSVRLQYTCALLFAVCALYGVILAFAQLVLQKKAVVGEEADLGVLIFIFGFHFLPAVLCLLSIRHG